ncbi:hypothetical protein EJ08DRAFT_663316 [Tothia fuscella]|uniref:Uncharacterized protein n=1 Tax=Tothia fuscella TaxID=1048955 RepID=A0A9P4NLU4_9PEZI|nr:hypothetical protein EJ08DRAFT_663316 [Tothia fuscella]
MATKPTQNNGTSSKPIHDTGLISLPVTTKEADKIFNSFTLVNFEAEEKKRLITIPDGKCVEKDNECTVHEDEDDDQIMDCVLAKLGDYENLPLAGEVLKAKLIPRMEDFIELVIDMVEERMK